MDARRLQGEGETVRPRSWPRPCNRYDPMDGGGKTASGTAVESRARNVGQGRTTQETKSRSLKIDV